VTWLLDVNVLVALAWPNHVHHATARRWFDEHAGEGWATTPVTESGFVRISSNRGALPTSTTPDLAIALLRSMTTLDGHEFWADDVRLVVGEAAAADGLRGHRQITDVHLLALARRWSGRLATFDRGLVTLGDDQLVDLVG
jgi:uncharacterized protein